MWTSKLGNRYPMSVMQANDASAQKELKRLRSLRDRGNQACADCGSHDTSWASVTHGVFICIVCSDVHRSVGTHITKMKGCTGTYLWGPDELEKMETVGNRRADELYGAEKVSPSASKEQKQRFVEKKYGREPLRVRTIPELVGQISLDKSVSEQSTCVHVASWQTPSVSLRANDSIATKSMIPDSFFDDLFGVTECPQDKVLPCVPCPPKHGSTFDGFGDSWGDMFGDSGAISAKKVHQCPIDLLF